MTHNAEKAIDFWLRVSQDNLNVTELMFKANRYSFAMFMCQQTVEAILKAVYILKKKERPQYIHKLPKLLDLTGIKVPKHIDTKILKIDAHYIKARYKEDRFNSKIYNKQNAQRLVAETKQVQQWFIKNLKLKI